MAKKSKTQRAKASAARAAKKAQEQEGASSEVVEAKVAEATEDKKAKKAVAKKEAAEKKQPKKEEKKPEKKAKKPGFLKETRNELKRVTWPSRPDVLRWSVVVVAALLFFGLYTFGFDNLFQFALTNYSSLGA